MRLQGVLVERRGRKRHESADDERRPRPARPSRRGGGPLVFRVVVVVEGRDELVAEALEVAQGRVLPRVAADALARAHEARVGGEGELAVERGYAQGSLSLAQRDALFAAMSSES